MVTRCSAVVCACGLALFVIIVAPGCSGTLGTAALASGSEVAEDDAADAGADPASAGDPCPTGGDSGDSGDPSTPSDAGAPVVDPSGVMVVASAAALKTALSTATPGTVIEVRPGTYAGQFDVTVSGEAGGAIVVRGPADRSALLTGGGSVGSWRGVLNLIGRHHVTIENLEIANTGAERYGVLVSATSGTSTDGSHDIVLRNLDVHDVGEEIIKIQGRNTHDIVVEDSVVHSNRDWSGIDVQGTWGGTPPLAQRPRRIVIRRNLIYDIGGSSVGAGIGNELADNVQAYDNVIVGSTMGLDIGCGNYNVVYNNLVTSYARFNALVVGGGYTTIDLGRYAAFADPSAFGRADCGDGIALSGNYRSLVVQNEVTGCSGDMILSYDHGPLHNAPNGHRQNLFSRNAIHDNAGYWIIEEYAKQAGGVSYDEVFYGNLLAENGSSGRYAFRHSVGLVFANNTLVGNGPVPLADSSTDARIANNLFAFASPGAGFTVDGTSTGSVAEGNCVSASSAVFADAAGGDYQLDPTAGAACIGSGADLTAVLQPIFESYSALFATQYAFDPDFPMSSTFLVDLAGRALSAPWDAGAYRTVP
ncbi:MAG: right-handed parallel beta-helix repeat-containing protein [Deltaproteobacteria bacterium]|nr:right-handed parallel beta-helix repeat-containing protein [Deltaproteobacteria bacterium]